MQEHVCAFGGLDVLCCNAGVMDLADERTVDGYEVQMQVNHLSHAILVNKLMPNLDHISKTAARVWRPSALVMVANAPHELVVDGERSFPRVLAGKSVSVELTDHGATPERAVTR